MAVLFASALAASGCSTSIADLPGAGLPSDSPQLPQETRRYMPVHDLPPGREQATMMPAEQSKLQAELLAARDRQAAAAAPK